MGQNTITASWRTKPHDEAASAELARELGLSPLLGQLLWNRDLRTREEATRFLRPTLDHLIDPERLDGIPEAVARISKALSRDEKILIYGDYDVDGMTSAALLYHFFKLVNARVDVFLPRRIEEGYGLNAGLFKRFQKEGVGLIVTVDCGITAIDEALAAREMGIDLVITDHHEPEARIPEAAAVINPKKPGSSYPYKYLAGVGVAFKLAWALAKHFSGEKTVQPEFREFLLNALGLVALGTVADVVPLTGENRVFVSTGLDALLNSRLPGVRALMNIAGIRDTLSARDVAFRLAPRLNAAGRMNEPELGLELLVTESFGRAVEIARDLDAKNKARQAIEKKILSSARKLLLKSCDPSKLRTILLAGKDWHPGVLGIVASRIAEEFYRPTLLLNIEGKLARGSARSIPPFHFFDALRSCQEHLVAYGGHAQAAGVTIATDAIDSLRDALEGVAAKVLSSDEMTPSMRVDAEVPLGDVTARLVRELAMLEPYGEGNPPPLFLARNLEAVGRHRRIGSDGQHLSFFVRSNSRGVRAVAFRMGHLASKLKDHDGVLSLLFEPQIDTWRGTGEAELIVRDIRFE